MNPAAEGHLLDPNTVTVSHAAERFLHSLDSETRATTQSEIQRFMRWYGSDKPLDGLRPHELESYSITVTSTTTDGRHRLEALRAFLAYTKRTGLIQENLSTHVRLARTGTKERASGAAATMIRLTPEGFVQLEEELDSLRNQRGQIAEDLKLAMADKDFRENAPLDAAREQQAHVEARIREIENTLRHATLMDKSDRKGGKLIAQLGSTVRLTSLADGKELRYTLVERSEVNPQQGKISIESPVGRALIGRAPGQEIEVVTPGGARKLRVDKIEDL